MTYCILTCLSSNLIFLQACSYRGEGHSPIICAVFLVLKGQEVNIPYPQKKTGPPTKPRKTSNVGKVSNSQSVSVSDGAEADFSDTPEVMNNVASSSKQSLFRYFCGQLFNHGVVKCRFKNEQKRIVVMNDYDPKTGDFKVLKSLAII